jgi:carotenoid cleavage oxygenase
MMVTPNPFLQGNFAPVAEEVTAQDLPVTGTLPPELDGRYLRIGPNPSGEYDPETYHWFLGDGMVHGIRLHAGRAEWYRNRVVRGETSSPNTNVIGHGGRLLAIVEAGGLPVAMSPDLDRMSDWDCDGALATGFTAHPKVDTATGELHSVSYAPGLPHLRYDVLDGAGKAIHAAELPVEGFPMVHDMALTDTRIVLLDLPVTLSMAALEQWEGSAPMSYQRFPMRWNEEHPSRVGILPRQGGPDDVTWVEAPRCYVFHVLNAYDDVPGDPHSPITMDVVRYDHMFRDELRGPSDTAPRLVRWSIDVARGRVSEQELSDLSVEFPRVDPARTGRAHRFGWFAGVGADGLVLTDDVRRSPLRGFEMGPLVKVDTQTGATTRHDYGTGRVTGEPAFVARPGAAGEDSAEDDGWILSVVHDATTDRSELVVLDAGDMAAAPIARVHLPQRVPFGFHGNWVSAAELD